MKLFSKILIFIWILVVMFFIVPQLLSYMDTTISLIIICLIFFVPILLINRFMLHRTYRSGVVFSSLVCLFAIPSIIYVNMIFPPPISKYLMEKEFINNKQMLIRVAKYLREQEYPDIYITSTFNPGEMYVSPNSVEVGETIHVPNDSIARDICLLFGKFHYEVITKDERGIQFQRWSNRDYGRGVVWSINGKLPQNENTIKLQPLSEKDWYFFEEN